jgi:uncharacterized protein (DUF427 family)
LLDAELSLQLNISADCQSSQYDVQVNFNGIALAMADRPGRQIRFRHPKGSFYLEKLVVVSDHLSRLLGLSVCVKHRWMS